MPENMKKLLEIVSASKELSAKLGGMGKEDVERALESICSVQ